MAARLGGGTVRFVVKQTTAAPAETGRQRADWRSRDKNTLLSHERNSMMGVVVFLTAVSFVICSLLRAVNCEQNIATK